MSSDFSYRDYVSDQSFAEGYEAYQRRYADKVRESDKVIIDIVQGLVADRDGAPTLLDVGCSTGNLLLHLKRTVPSLALTGGDLMPNVLETCRSNPELQDIRFVEMDMLDLGIEEEYDIVTVNAVLYMFRDEEFGRALASASRALRPDGHLVVFDFFHPYEQDLAILEKSRSHPKGLMLHFRPYRSVRETLERNNLADIRFQPFEIPIDLEKGSTYRDNADGFEDLNSYTVNTEEGGRLIFRGTLYTPWCHLVARKSS